MSNATNVNLQARLAELNASDKIAARVLARQSRAIKRRFFLAKFKVSSL